MSSNHNQQAGHAAPRARWLHLMLGLLAGAAYWGVVEWAWTMVPDRAAVFALMVVLIGFGVAGILLAELGLRRALAMGALMGGIVGGLVMLSMSNFETAQAYFETGHVVVAILVLATIPVPFALGWLRDGRHFSYRHLFMDSWTIVVRYAAAWAFAGLALGVAYASSALLELVGVDLLRDLLREDVVVAVLLGGLVGLGLAVVAELNDLISPYLVLRLVRLLTPFVLLVLAVFVGMIPVRGLTALFDGLSTGGSLMTAGLGAVALVSIVVDRGDLDAPSRGVLYWSARIMAGLVIVLGGLAVAAVWLRVGQYGWTPERVSAAAVALVVLGYGAVYAVALLRGAQWRAGVRAGNWTMAIGVVGLAAVWLNPWVTPETISARSQMARLDPEVDAARFPLWEMKHNWGQAGVAALADLEAAGAPRMTLRLAALTEATSLYDFMNKQMDSQTARTRLQGLIPVLPEGRMLPDAFFDQVVSDVDAMDGYDADCAQRTPQGNPGCLVVIADVVANAPGEELLVLRGNTVSLLSEAAYADGLRPDYMWGLPEGLSPETAIDLFWSEGLGLTPSGDQVFSIGGQQIGPRSR